MSSSRGLRGADELSQALRVSEASWTVVFIKARDRLAQATLGEEARGRVYFPACRIRAGSCIKAGERLAGVSLEEVPWAADSLLVERYLSTVMACAGPARSGLSGNHRCLGPPTR